MCDISLINKFELNFQTTFDKTRMDLELQTGSISREIKLNLIQSDWIAGMGMAVNGGKWLLLSFYFRDLYLISDGVKVFITALEHYAKFRNFSAIWLQKAVL